MPGDSPYQSKLVNLMLTKEKVFIQFQSCYYMLYQCLVPNTREALSLLVQHYTFPNNFERSILSGENPRLCNQGILNYLLIKLRVDKNFVKFWGTLKMMINHPELRFAVEKLQKKMSSISTCDVTTTTTKHDLENLFPVDERALSVTDSDDDYCVSYTVTTVNVRTCARPPRTLISNNRYPGFAELQSHYSVLVRSMPDDYMNTVSQLERHLTGDHIGTILECKDVCTANQAILDCLIEQLSDEKDAFDLCNWLSVIADAPVLTAAIDELKKDVITGIKSGTTSSGVTTVDVEASLTPNDLSRSSLKVSTGMSEPEIFGRLPPEQYGPKALAVLKKHYHIILKSLPDDHLVTLTVLSEECENINTQVVQMVTALQSPELANRIMLDYIIVILNGDQQMIAFCNLMEKMINNPALSKVVSALRADCQRVMFDNWFKSLLMPKVTASSTGSSSEQPGLETVFHEHVIPVSGDAPPQQDSGDIGASVIDHLPAGVSAQCRSMLHSYYDTLWQSFPQDHLITLSRLCDLLPVEERLVETIALYPTSDHDKANRRILNAALSNVKRDNELLGFSVLVEKLIANPNKAKMTEKFKSDCVMVMEKKQTDLIGPPLPSENAVQSEGEMEDTALITDEPIEDDSLALYFCSPKISDNCIALLRKHYKSLVDCLPDDHFVTLSTLSSIMHIRDSFFDEVLSCTDSRKANKRILNSMIMVLTDDSEINGFCKVLRDIIGMIYPV